MFKSDELQAWRPTRLEIDLDAITQNMRIINKMLEKDIRLMGVLKADAYGHGAVEIARHLLQEGMTALGVSLLDEGIELRKAGLGAPILVFNYVPAERCPLLVRYGLTASVFDLNGAQALSQAAQQQGRKINVHVKVDTGMSRLGIRPKDVLDFVSQLKALPHLEVEGIYSHYATAEDYDKTHALEQHNAFVSVCQTLKRAGILPSLRHIANTSGVMSMPLKGQNMVRTGAALYGQYPSEAIRETGIVLQEAACFKTVVSMVKEVPAGTAVGYGRTFIAPQSMILATLPVGYADGLQRRFSHQSGVLIKGTYAPFVGNICMDQCMVDVSHLSDIVVGDEVVLFGSQGEASITMDNLAAMLGTINIEIACLISRRVPRVYIKGGKVVKVNSYLLGNTK